MANKNPENKFAKDSQPERGRGKGKRTLMLDAIREVSGSEEEFLKEVVQCALTGGPDGTVNTTLMSLVIQRISPPFKSMMPMVEFAFDVDATPASQAAQVMKAASKGLIAPDIANMFIGSIASMLKIDEVTELQKRLEAIEATLGGANG